MTDAEPRTTEDRTQDIFADFTNVAKDFTTNVRQSVSKMVEQIANSGAFPLLDVYETPESVVIRTMPLDGAIPDSFEVAMTGNMLTLSGETHPGEEIPDEAFLHRERFFGKFTRTVQIPREVIADEARAKFKNSVLTITLPKVEDTRPKVINVQLTDE